MYKLWIKEIQRGERGVMATQQELDVVYMQMARNLATLSKGVRAKVGAIAVTKQGVIITGINGLPKQLGNELEYRDMRLVSTFGESPRWEEGELITKDEVIHAENNILVKCAREGVSLLDSTVYVTLSCCKHCSSMLSVSGVSRVVYDTPYKDLSGIGILEQCGITVDKLSDLL